MRHITNLKRKLHGEFWTLQGLHISEQWGFLIEWVSPSGLDWVEALGFDYSEVKKSVLNSIDMEKSGS